MKFKYKKLIALISIVTMFLSFIIISIIPNEGDQSVDSNEKQAEEQSLLKIENPQILKMIESYYTAKANLDFETAGELVSDPLKIPQSNWQDSVNVGGLEQYSNFVCYGIENEKQSAFSIFIQYDLKFQGIDTLCPSFTYLYVKLGSDERYLIYLSAVDEEEDEFIEASKQNKEVIQLIEDTRRRLQAACASDPKLAEKQKLMEEAITAAAREKNPESDAPVTSVVPSIVPSVIPTVIPTAIPTAAPVVSTAPPAASVVPQKPAVPAQ
ncbi:MAG: hypothetical protein LBR68_07710 [Lachnoclostridium sp.]|jgi:hypothetical protein|nr:hypothetical protein [Lachnoclostridium sp.]